MDVWNKMKNWGKEVYREGKKMSINLAVKLKGLLKEGEKQNRNEIDPYTVFWKDEAVKWAFVTIMIWKFAEVN